MDMSDIVIKMAENYKASEKATEDMRNAMKSYDVAGATRHFTLLRSIREERVGLLQTSLDLLREQEKEEPEEESIKHLIKHGEQTLESTIKANKEIDQTLEFANTVVPIFGKTTEC